MKMKASCMMVITSSWTLKWRSTYPRSHTKAANLMKNYTSMAFLISTVAEPSKIWKVAQTRWFKHIHWNLMMMLIRQFIVLKQKWSTEDLMGASWSESPGSSRTWTKWAHGDAETHLQSEFLMGDFYHINQAKNIMINQSEMAISSLLFWIVS